MNKIATYSMLMSWSQRFAVAVLLLLAACNNKDQAPKPPAPILSLAAPANGTLAYEAEETLRVVAVANAEGTVANIRYQITPQFPAGWHYNAAKSFNSTFVRDTTDIYLPTSAPSGNYVLSVTVTDQAGQTASETRAFSFTNPTDLAAPSITLLTPAPGSTLSLQAGDVFQVRANFADDAGLDMLQVRLFTEDNLVSNLLRTKQLSGITDSFDEQLMIPQNTLHGRYNLTLLVSDGALNVTTATVPVVISAD
jgi:hypothetical protein